MDGIDISLVQTNGLDLQRLDKNYFYEYSLNTINNTRYKNLISFKGEIRAYF